MRYLDDGEVPIDNNWIENQVRPWALGRKNWLFGGSQRSGQRAANVMSLIQSAKINGLDPAGLPARCALASTQHGVLRDRQSPTAQLEPGHQGVMAGYLHTLLNSDVSTVNRIGNSTFGSDGTTCTNIGASTFWN